MEVGPLARMAVAYGRGHVRAREEIDSLLGALGPAGGGALFSTLGRVAARGIETLLMAEQMDGWIDATGEPTCSAATSRSTMASAGIRPPGPRDAVGWAPPRRRAARWATGCTSSTARIANYQMVVPSTWNGSPRDARGQRGPWELALLGTPVANQDQPLEMLRTMHSFDPCMSCSVHLTDTTGRELVRVYADH